MSEEINTTENPGKGKNIAGFVLSLVAFLFGGWLMGALYVSGGKGAAMLALLVPIAAIVISVMGMKASKAAGHKAGLAVAGLVIGIVALVWLIFWFLGLGALDAALENGLDTLENSEALQEALENALEEAAEQH